jgi:cytochrome c oxidase subunit II
VVQITLVNKDVAHGIALPDFSFSLTADAGGTATGQFTADKTGTFVFFCNVFCGEGHRNMKGTLIVQ